MARRVPRPDIRPPSLAERCTECDGPTSLPVLCADCRQALRDASAEAYPWPEDAPYVAPVSYVTRWAVPVPYVPDVTQDDYEELP